MNSEVRLKRLSKKFIKDILDLSAGYISSQDFEKLIELINREIQSHYFTESSENNLFRIIRSRYDKAIFLTECLNYPHYVEILLAISSNSNYLSDILEFSPEYFYLVVDPSRLNKKLIQKDFENEVSEILQKFKELDAKVRALKNIKRKEILRIGLKDIYLKFSLKEITEQLSVLSNIIAGQLFNICFDEVISNRKLENVDKDFVIISLGKLGGNELNYSSDIDLIIYYEKNYRLKNGKLYNEILIEVIRLFISKMSSSEGGFLYRVDLRLRPDGRNSALCGSISEYLAYYERRGEDWERQMLIKAGFVCGNKKLFDYFLNYLQPFIYPVSHTSSPLDEIRRLKKSSEKLTGENDDIKIQPGGIRDIEFAVQAMQLLNGGINKSLRIRNTLTAINKLFENSLITEEELGLMNSSYIFYRKIEHYLQLMNNAQTHEIPRNDELEEKIAHYLGFNKVENFRNEVRLKRKQVRRFYDSVTGEKIDKTKGINSIENIPFADKIRAEKNFNFLREGKGVLGKKSFDTKTMNLYGNIEKQLFTYLANSKLPDKTLDNFVRIIRFADFPSIWYKEFTDPKFLKYFLSVCEYSQRAVNLFAEDKSLRDYLLSRDVFKKLIKKNLGELDLKKLLFILAVQVATGLLQPIKVSEFMSEWVCVKMKSIIDDEVNGLNWRNDFFIAVMGSAGSSEMTFASDVDLAIAFKNLKKNPNAESEFIQILKSIREELSPFQVDCRLRPEGKSSQLVWDIESYKKYINERARTWEFQALIKLKFISGNKNLFNSFLNTIIKEIKNIDYKKIKNDMIEMRKKLVPSLAISQTNLFDLKKNRGGITDIEFVCHYYLIKNNLVNKKLFGLPLNKIINEIKKTGMEDSIKIDLADNFEFLKQIEILNQAFSGNNSSKISEDEISFSIISDLLGVKNLKKKYFDVIKFNSNYYNKTFGNR